MRLAVFEAVAQALRSLPSPLEGGARPLEMIAEDDQAEDDHGKSRPGHCRNGHDQPRQEDQKAEHNPYCFAHGTDFSTRGRTIVPGPKTNLLPQK
jgi:hypothetical protein